MFSRRTGLAIALGLAIFAVSIGIIWYRSRYPLSATRLDQARQLWREHGPVSYNLLITIEGRMPGTYWVEVRKGQVVRAVQRPSQHQEVDLLTVVLPDGRVLRRDGLEWTVPGLFDWLERDLERDRAGTSSYTYLRFDPRDGHPIEYVRSESSQRYRFHVQLFLVHDE
ncbi:MAG: hypothetical protein NZM42_01395 [Gemmatales bacterium]|nr:hypothetical protein [Gemmatales bacterium]MDW8222237.1 hypothetical protein [Gemmatales bacterium]